MRKIYIYIIINFFALSLVNFVYASTMECPVFDGDQSDGDQKYTLDGPYYWRWVQTSHSCTNCGTDVWMNCEGSGSQKSADYCCGSCCKRHWSASPIAAVNIPGYDPGLTGGGLDVDEDGTPDWTDPAPNDPNVPINDPEGDADGDGINNFNDPEPLNPNLPLQEWDDPPLDGDFDGDGVLDPDDEDIDGDGILNSEDDDHDNDGIPNDNDLAPFSTDNPRWKVDTKFYNNGPGEGVEPDGYIFIDENGMYYFHGDTSGEPVKYIEIGGDEDSFWNDPEDFDFNMGGGGSGGGGTGDGGNNQGTPINPGSSGDPGEIDPPQGDGEGTEIELLEDIQHNTGATAGGLRIVSEILQGIEVEQAQLGLANINQLEQIESAIKNQSTGNGITGEDIVTALAGDRAAGDADAEAERGIQTSSIEGLSPEYSGYLDSDIPTYTDEESDVQTKADNLLTTSDLAAVRDSVGVQTSGSVSSLSCSVLGANIVFDFAPYSYILDAVGVLVLSLCYLCGFFMILRG